MTSGNYGFNFVFVWKFNVKLNPSAMKKIVVLIALFVFFIPGCEKVRENDASTTELLKGISRITNMSYEELLFCCSNRTLSINKYSLAGEKVYSSLEEFSKKYTENVNKNIAPDSLILNLLYSSLPNEYWLLPQDNFYDSESKIYSAIVNSVVKSKPEEAFLKLSFVEDEISKNVFLGENSKKRLLVFCSVYKYSCKYLDELSELKKSQTFDDCFRSKMSKIFDQGGVLERLHCVVDWPVCLSVAAADCAIELLS